MSHRKLSIAASVAAAALGAVLTAPAHASLVLLGTADLTGQGIGAQFTVLTLQTGPNSTESGAVTFAGLAVGDASTGSSQSRSFTFADLAITDASQLRLIVNLAEPGSETTPSVLATSTGSFSNLASRITLNAFSSSGLLLQQHTLASDLTLNQIASGVGGSGLIFGLNAAEATQLNTFISANAGFEVFTVGATFANAAGGNDVIQAARFTGTTPPIPEPETYALLLAGLGVVGFVAHRRKRAERS